MLLLNGVALTLNSVKMDPIKRGVLNVVESVIETLFIRQPNINAIQQWIGENHESSMNEDASRDFRQGTSSPLVVPPLTKNEGDSAKKAHKPSKNARKKLQRKSS